MAFLLNRPQWRDWIRRRLQITPPVDVGAGPIGAQPDYYPLPTNEVINDCLQSALNRISSYCGCHIASVFLDAEAQSSSSTGPYSTSLSGFQSVTGSVTDIQSAWWTPDGGTQMLLQPTSREILVRFQNTYYQQTPATPMQWYVEGYTFYATPAQSEDGTFTLICGTGFTGLQTEFDPVDQLPIDYQDTIGYEALGLLSLQQTMDIEARERAASFLPLAMEGKMQIKAWKEGGTGTVQPQFAVASYRMSYGTRRVRR